MMPGSAPGRTIKLFLVDGSPSGLILAEIHNWTGKVLSFPRGLLPHVLKTREEVAKTGVYFLLGPDPENPYRPFVYVGESDDLAKRLTWHDKDDAKDFFEQITLIVSKDQNLTKAHGRYLESRLIDIIRQAGEAALKNGNAGQPVSLPESDQADMEYFLQQVRTVLPVLGLNFLQEIPRSKSTALTITDAVHAVVEPAESPQFELSYLNGKVHADAYEAEGQFVVRAGAVCRHPDEATKPLKDARYAYIMNDLRSSLANGTLAVASGQTGFARLTRDKAFKSPSRAASFVCANPMSGHTYWRLKASGQTYGEWREQELNVSQSQPIIEQEVFPDGQ